MSKRIARDAAAGAYFGLFFGLYVYVDSGSLDKGAVAGLVTGFGFLACTLLIDFLVERVPIFGASAPGGWASDELIVKKGLANMSKAGMATGGILYLTDKRLRFCCHRLSIEVGDYSFLLRNIRDILPRYLAAIVVILDDGRRVTFIVYDRPEWVAAIKRQAGLQEAD